MPPPNAVAKDVSDPPPLTCPTPTIASAKGRSFPTENERRGPKSMLYSWAFTPCGVQTSGQRMVESAEPKVWVKSATMPTWGRTFPSSEPVHPLRLERPAENQSALAKEYPKKMFRLVGAWAVARLANKSTMQPRERELRMLVSLFRL